MEVSATMNHPPRYQLVAIAPGFEHTLWDPASRLAAAPKLTEQTPKQATPIGDTARASIIGSITPDFCIDLRRWLLSVSGSDRYSSILIEVASPGGSSAGLAETCEILRRVRKLKTITVVVTGFCCSAAFELSMQANKVLATPSSTFGSVGVRMTLVDSVEFYKQMGLRIVPISTSPKKVLGLDGTPIGDEAVDYFQSYVDEGMVDFKEQLLASGRISPKQLEQLSDASIFSAKEAKRRGLIDDIVLFEDVLEELDNRTAISNLKADMYAELKGEAAYDKYVELVLKRANTDCISEVPNRHHEAMKKDFPTLATRYGEIYSSRFYDPHERQRRGRY
jgi:ClpP class serine protease